MLALLVLLVFAVAANLPPAEGALAPALLLFAADLPPPEGAMALALLLLAADLSPTEEALAPALLLFAADLPPAGKVAAAVGAAYLLVGDSTRTTLRYPSLPISVSVSVSDPYPSVSEPTSEESGLCGG